MSENKARTNPDQYGKPTPKGTFPANLLGDVRSSWMDVDKTQNLAQHSSQSPLPPPLDNCRPHRCFQSPSKTNNQNWISNCMNCMIAAVEWQCSKKLVWNALNYWPSALVFSHVFSASSCPFYWFHYRGPLSEGITPCDGEEMFCHKFFQCVVQVQTLDWARWSAKPSKLSTLSRFLVKKNYKQSNVFNWWCFEHVMLCNAHTCAIWTQ